MGDFLFVDGDALDPPKGSTKAAPGTPSSASDEASDGEVRPVPSVLLRRSGSARSAVTTLLLLPYLSCAPSSCFSPKLHAFIARHLPAHTVVAVPVPVLQVGPTSSARTSGHSPLGSACRAWGVVQLVAVEGVEGDEGDGSKAKGNGKGRAPPFKLRVRTPLPGSRLQHSARHGPWCTSVAISLPHLSKGHGSVTCTTHPVVAVHSPNHSRCTATTAPRTSLPTWPTRPAGGTCTRLHLHLLPRSPWEEARALRRRSRSRRGPPAARSGPAALRARTPGCTWWARAACAAPPVWSGGPERQMRPGRLLLLLPQVI